MRFAFSYYRLHTDIVCQPHGERGLLACDLLPITLSVWTVSLGNLRIQNIFGGFHVRSQPSLSVEEVFDDLLVSHKTRTEPVLPIRLSSRQPKLLPPFVSFGPS